MFGVYNLSDLYEPGKVQLVPEEIFIHDDWRPDDENYDADIALLQFGDEIAFTRYIQPICLWNEDEEPTQTLGFVAGWGQSQDLLKDFEEIPTQIEVSIYDSNENCFYKDKDLVDLSSNRTFCGGRGDGTGICFGDSGSGLSIWVNGFSYLRGIVSSGLVTQTSCDVIAPAVYTNVLKYKTWIQEKDCVDKKGLACDQNGRSGLKKFNTNIHLILRFCFLLQKKLPRRAQIFRIMKLWNKVTKKLFMKNSRT